MNARGFGPIADVSSPDLTCRYTPLEAPALHAVARAGANVTFKWTDWFTNHKGPLFTYMGLLPTEQTSPQEVEFFKIDEATFDPASMTWGTDWLIKNNNYHTVTIPSDLKPGMYVLRHEIVSLHFSFRDDAQAKTSGAQFFPQCSKVQVIGDGTATPPGQKIPGAYKWDDEGILTNIYYGPNRYVSPGPNVYKGPGAAPKGPQPVVPETGALSGEKAKEYADFKAKSIKEFEDIVHADSDNKHGGGGCHWAPGSDPSTATCSATNPGMPEWAGFAQPKSSPMFMEKPGARGAKSTNVFDPTKPRENKENPRAAVAFMA
jgi:cellulase